MSFVRKIIPFLKARYAPRGARQTFSASAEDLIMYDFLKSHGISRVSYIDIGAHDPVFGNNTYLFYRNGGRGVLVEPNKRICKSIESKRHRDTCVNVGVGKSKTESNFFLFDQTTRSTFSKNEADAFESRTGKKPKVELVQIFSLDDIITHYHAGTPVDVISIDAEGLDVDILSGFSFSQKPKVFCVEYVSSKAKKDLGDVHEIQTILEKNDYSMYARTKSNAIFVQNNLL